MLTDIAPFFDEIFTGWRVSFLTLEPGTLRVCASMSAPSPANSRIRSSAIQVGLESTLSAGFPLVGIGTGDILSKTVGMLRSRQAFGFCWKQGFEAAMPEMSISMKWTPIRFANGHPFAGDGRANRVPNRP
jgi:hypothetical protein